ncbi:MAG TPA: class I SAM-dependent methyltransferase [Pseudonocardiaceae bacterium]|jgi:2-polyprenyl-3-methyl-5-hydroxy-6-metoxy-1,4-benzoquinol methylase|nr:class I SAM-dependent methyltransferase [Pseudonocardiaceae bacterium]
MDQVLARLFDNVPLRGSLDDFAPADTTPWDRVEVDAFLEQEYQRSRADLTAGATVSKVEAALHWVRSGLNLPAGADILDVGCGVGLYCHRLAQHGYRVTGTDVSDSFLTFAHARATANAVSCSYRKLSAFDMDFINEFDFVLITQGPSLQLTQEELHGFLVRAKQALRPRGHLVCEFSTIPADLQACAAEATLSAHLSGRILLGKPLRAQMFRKLIFPEARQRVNHRIFLYQDGALVEFWSRFFMHTPDELVTVLERTGFEVRGIFGPVIGQPLLTGNQTCHIWATLGKTTGGSG